MSQYFIKRGEKIHGPFSTKQVKSGLESGKLKDADLISESKSGPWQTVRGQLQEPATLAEANAEDFPTTTVPKIGAEWSQALLESAKKDIQENSNESNIDTPAASAKQRINYDKLSETKYRVSCSYEKLVNVLRITVRNSDAVLSEANMAGGNFKVKFSLLSDLEIELKIIKNADSATIEFKDAKLRNLVMRSGLWAYFKHEKQRSILCTELKNVLNSTDTLQKLSDPSYLKILSANERAAIAKRQKERQWLVVNQTTCSLVFVMLLILLLAACAAPFLIVILVS